MPPKKPKPSAEEKKLQAAEKKREKKRQIEEMKRKVKVDELNREVKYGSMSVKRHEKDWKKLLLDIAVPEMRSELEYAWHNFERVIDAKDFTISLLMDEVQDAEEQYMKNFRSHCESVDKLVVLFREQLSELKDDYNRTVCTLKREVDNEIEMIKISHSDGEEYLKMMLFGLEMTQKEQEQFIRCEYCSRLEEEGGRHKEALHKLRYLSKKNYAKLYFTTLDYIKEYQHSTAERRKQYEFLNTQDGQMKDLLKNQLNKIKRMINTIRQLRQKFTVLQNTQGQNVHDLLMERKFFADSFWALKTQLEDEITTDNKNLTLLTGEYSKSAEYLKRIERKGEQILQLAAVCRKFETLEEKILPFPIQGKATGGGSESYMQIDINAYSDIADLELFWKRVSQANVLRYSIYEERAFLRKENDKLKIKIHEYCECLNCEAYPSPETRQRHAINKIDGKVEMKKYEKHKNALFDNHHLNRFND